jgi:predicted DNA-binding transcriptional regulator AlpA
MTNKLITLDEAAARLRTPPSTLRFWRHSRTGPPSTKIGRRVMYREHELDSWVEAQFAAAGNGNPAA